MLHGARRQRRARPYYVGKTNGSVVVTEDGGDMRGEGAVVNAYFDNGLVVIHSNGRRA